MSIDGAKRLITQYQQPDSKGGALHWSREVENVWNEITKPEPGDQVGADGKKKTLSADEAKLWAELGNVRMSGKGRRFYQRFSQNVEGLIQVPGGGGGEAHGRALTPGNAKRPVFLNPAGWPVPDANIEGQPDPAKAEEGLYRFALAISQAVQGGGQLEALARLSNGDKSRLVGNTISMAKRSLRAGGQLDGLTQDETSQLRSSAFTALVALGQSVAPRGTTARLSGRIHEAVVQMAKDEPNQRLGQHMARVMDRADYRNSIGADQVPDIKEIFAEKIPQKFDVGNILDDEGYLNWDHLCGQGEGFMRSFVMNLKKESVHGAKFELKKEDFRGSEFELKFPQPRGEDGRVKGIRIKVSEFRNNMFDAVGKKTGFSYGGHSNIGQNQEQSLARAVAAGLKADTPQICMLDLCAGLDNLDDDMEKLGNLEVLTTFGSSFFWKGDLQDAQGEFEGVTKSEGMESLMAMFSGLSNEENYEKLRGRVTDAIHHYSHERNPNVAFPTLTDYREVRWAHLDGDDDGRMDAGDVLYQFGLKTAMKDLANEFVFQDNGRFDEVNGDGIKDAVLDLNVSTHYNAEMDQNKTVEHKFIANGFFDGAGSSDLLRIAPTQNHDGKPAFKVSYNHQLAHTSKEAMSALTQYSSVMWMADNDKVRGLSETDSKVMGLAFATFRLNYDGKGRNDDQRVWKQMLQVLRLPSDMPYAPMARLIDNEHDDYAGNMEIVRNYKDSLSEATLAALETKGVGRPGGGPPVA